MTASLPVNDTQQTPICVLYVVPGSPKGHNMVFARDAAQALRERGVCVEEFYLRSRTAPLQVVRAAIQLYRQIRRCTPDIVHAQYGGVTGLVTALAVGRIPLVVSVRGSDLNRVPSMHPVRGWLTRLLTQLAVLRARKVICVSPALAAQLWNDKKASVIPSGVDTDLFRPIDRDAARFSLGWLHDQCVVLFNAGQAPEQKGLPLVEQALRQLNAQGLDAKLHVVNGGHTRPEMAALMGAADCLVLASLTEGSPNVVKEAMACDLPVVSVLVGDVAQRLAGVTPGFIVERSPDAIADALVVVLRQRCRSNGRNALLRQRLSIDHTTTALHDLYIDLVRRDTVRLQ